MFTFIFSYKITHLKRCLSTLCSA